MYRDNWQRAQDYAQQTQDEARRDREYEMSGVWGESPKPMTFKVDTGNRDNWLSLANTEITLPWYGAIKLSDAKTYHWTDTVAFDSPVGVIEFTTGQVKVFPNKPFFY